MLSSYRLPQWRTWIVLLAIGLCGRLTASAADRDLLAHWPLETDARDLGPHTLATTNNGVRFESQQLDGRNTPSARFDGRGARLTVDSQRIPEFVGGDFTLAIWINTDEASDDDLGDLITHYDPTRRVGMQLGLRTNTGVTSSQANTRQLQFGIDAGSTPTWRDEGRPGQALLAFSMAVHDGALYAGTCEPAADSAGHVYRYQPDDSEHRWLDLGSPDKANAISAMAEYRGRLYVGTAKYRLAGSALTESENPHDGGRIFRLEEDGRWTDVGRLHDDQIAIGGLVEYGGRLYASSLYRPAGFFRYERDGEWTSLPTPDGLRVEALGVFNGFLWASSYDGGYVFRFDGHEWKSFGQVGDNTQTYSFAIHRGRLCVGTWPSGKVYRLDDNDTWQDIGQLGEEREVMGMLVYNGQLYAGTLPLAEVHRYDGAQAWTRLARLDHTPDVTYRRAWTMAQYRGRLFVSTLPSGQIHSMQAGECVTFDRALEAGWRHIVAQRAGNRLRLFVDGRQVAESTPLDAKKYELSVDAPLLIGAGAGDYFRGGMRDVRIYSRALTPTEIQTLGQPTAN